MAGEAQSAETRFQICDLPVGPFPSVALHAPAREGSTLRADVETREGVSPYLWTLRDFAAERMLPFVLTDRDAMTNLGFLVSHLEEKLAKLAEKQRGPYLEVADEDTGYRPGEDQIGRISETDALGAEDFMTSSHKPRLTTFLELVDYIEYKLLLEGAEDEESSKGGNRAWTANQAKATREAFIRRLRGASKHLRGLLRGDLSQKEVSRSRLDILNSEKQVHVVDIHNLAPLAQMFVVGVLLKQVFGVQESRSGKGQVFVVLDELNKYAPCRGGQPHQRRAPRHRRARAQHGHRPHRGAADRV